MSKRTSPTSIVEKKKELSQYRVLAREIRAEKMRLAQLAARLLQQNPLAAGRAASGSAQEPGGEELLASAGMSALWDASALAGYRARIEENVARCLRLAEEIQCYINRIEDSETRRMFTLRYINGYSWQKVAFLMGGYDESWPRKKHDRYLREHP